MMEFKDQLGRVIKLAEKPTRIVSVVPSQTELLFDLGLDEEVVGLTKFCVHPNDKWKSVQRVGGTKKLHFNVIDDLKPDLIIANKEENTQEEIERLAQKYPVWISDIRSIPAALEMIKQVGELVGKRGQAIQLADKIQLEWDGLKDKAKEIKVAYAIWNEPLMLAGNDTFIHEVLTWMGFENVALKFNDRYPSVSSLQLIQAEAEIVFLSSEPYPFDESHQKQFVRKLPQIERGFPLVDGEMFSWYGSRMLLATAYFKRLLMELSLRR